MKKQKAKELGKLLLQKRQELTKTYLATQVKSVNAPHDGAEDYIDYAVNSYTKEFLLSLSDMDRRVLKLVESALKKIDDVTFGVCEECSEPISDKRLEAVPWARHCLSCQEMEERKLAEAAK